MHRAIAGLAVLAWAAPIPWLPQRPAPLGPAKPPLAPACRAQDLRARIGLQGATGSLVGGVVLRNAGTRACSLLGRPGVRLVGNGAEGVRLTVRPAAAVRVGSVVTPPRSSLRALRPGALAWVGLFWSNWCGTRPPAMLVLTLPRRGGEFRLSPGGAPRCDAPSSASSLGVEPFTPREREPARSSKLPLRATIPGPTSKLMPPRYRARPGQALRYTVVLRNVSERPFRFGRCPTYVEQLVPGGPLERYVLNCVPAGTLAPGASATFAMVLHVPARAFVGRHGLSWQLAPATYDPPFATAQVVVVRG